MRVGGYELLNELGRGGMGVVYRVRTPSGEEAALKLLVSSSAGTLARFERERRLLASLGEEQGFVALLDAGSSPEGAWLLMPFVPGGTLRQRLEAGPLGVDETVALGIELARALGRAHERGIVHRDVKPENVLFTGGPGAEPPNERWSGRALVADLGLAKHFDPTAKGASLSVALTAQGSLKGTAGYMAPEQIADASSVRPPTDVFALGAVLHECLAGRPAFEGKDVLEVLAKVSSGVRPRLGRPDVPAWLEKTLERALALDPGERFSDGASLARALESRGEGARAAPRGRLPWVPLVVGASAGALALLLIALGLPAPVPRTQEAAAPPPAAPPSAKPEIPAPLPEGLRFAERKVEAAEGTEVALYLYGLPDGSDMEMVQVPAGDFAMGAEDGDASSQEKPQHRHAVSRPYWIGRNDVTWAQYLSFCKETGKEEPEKPSWWRQVKGTWDDHPVVAVSWEEARSFARWAKLELPSEAEWEKAARGPEGKKWPWGNAWDPGLRCNFADASCPLDELDAAGGKKLSRTFKEQGWEWDREHDDGHAFTSPVGSFPRGASPHGALDMAGNVWQWCEDWYEERAYLRYAKGDYTPPPGGSSRVVRGGSWRRDARVCRSSSRFWYAPSYRSSALGFRVVLRSP